MSTHVYWQPKDRSLPAFREWLEGKYQINPRPRNLTRLWFSEKEWHENCKKYWSKVDGSSKGNEPKEL